MAIPEVLELPAVPPPGASRVFVSQNPSPVFQTHSGQSSQCTFCFRAGVFSPPVEIIFCASFKALFGPPSSHEAEGDVGATRAARQISGEEIPA